MFKHNYIKNISNKNLDVHCDVCNKRTRGKICEVCYKNNNYVCKVCHEKNQIADQNHKYCTQCQKYKKLNKFYKDLRQGDSLTPQCKTCRLKYEKGRSK